jgi:hypothetical protein
MRRSTIKIICFGLGLFLLLFGCGPRQIEKETIYHSRKVFAKEYDKVWDTLEVVMEELMYPIKVKDKKRGVIETHWISIIKLRGTLRWNVRILVNKRDDGTMVRVYDRVEKPQEIMGTFKNKKGETKTGWQVSEEKIADVNDILRLLNVRLEEE